MDKPQADPRLPTADSRLPFERPLTGLTAIEWATGVAGPYCGKLLAGFGAEVIKVEPPAGDPARHQPPFSGDTPDPDRGILFLFLNTGKRSLRIDTARPAGRRLLDDLIRGAAILIEDHRPADLAALGLGYDHWAALNPGLIVTSITPFGQTGPRADHRAHHLNSAHAGGEGYTLAGSLTGVDRPPVKVGSRVADFDAGVSGLIATLAAVYERELSGRGQHVDISAQDAGLSLSRVIHGRYTWDGLIESRLVRQRRPGTLLKCGRGYVEVVLVTDQTWEIMCRVIGRPELVADPRYVNRFERELRSEEVNEILEAWAAAYTNVEVAGLLQENHVPGGAYLDLDEVAASPQYAHREFFRVIDHPVAGAAPYPTVGYRLSGTPWEVVDPAPRLGADTDQVLRERLGLSEGDLAALRSEGII